MSSKFWNKGGLPGILHHYTEKLVAFEYTSGIVEKPHSLLFLGGLSDGLATTEYTADLVHALQPTQWSLFTLVLSSSYAQWGLGHLDKDTDEIAECVRYILDIKTSKFGNSKIVLMGHSTGSQAVLHYLHAPNPHTSSLSFDPEHLHVTRPVVDGAILQAPVSDREAILWVMKEGFAGKSAMEVRAVYHQIESITENASHGDHSFDTILPLNLTAQIGYPGAPISCRRMMSLASPASPQAPGEDDLFSSDLSDEQLFRTFGYIKTQGLLRGKLVVLFSGADQSVPEWVDKEKLLRRWRNAADHGGRYHIWNHEFSAVIPCASHGLSDSDQAEPRRDLVERVVGYLHKMGSE